jgi:hypothetical protein
VHEDYQPASRIRYPPAFGWYFLAILTTIIIPFAHWLKLIKPAYLLLMIKKINYLQ